MKKIIFTSVIILLSYCSTITAANNYYNPFTATAVTRAGTPTVDNESYIMELVKYVSNPSFSYEYITSINIYRFDNDNIGKTQNFISSQYNDYKKFFHNAELSGDSISIKYLCGRKNVSDMLIFFKDKTKKHMMLHIKCNIPINEFNNYLSTYTLSAL